MNEYFYATVPGRIIRRIIFFYSLLTSKNQIYIDCISLMCTYDTPFIIVTIDLNM